MIRYKPNCKACQLSKKDPRLRQRIYQAAYRREDGDETLYQIADREGFNRAALYNHVKKHTTEVQKSLEVQTAKKVAEVKANVDNKLVDHFEGKEPITPQLHNDVLDEVMAIGLADVKAGRLKVTVSHALAAARQKAENLSKQKNLQLDIMKTMFAFASGEKKKIEKGKDEQPTELPAGDPNQGADGPDSLYHQIIGNAVAQGAEELPKQNTN